MGKLKFQTQNILRWSLVSVLFLLGSVWVYTLNFEGKKQTSVLQQWTLAQLTVPQSVDGASRFIASVKPEPSVFSNSLQQQEKQIQNWNRSLLHSLSSRGLVNMGDHQISPLERVQFEELQGQYRLWTNPQNDQQVWRLEKISTAVEISNSLVLEKFLQFSKPGLKPDDLTVRYDSQGFIEDIQLK